MEGNYMANDVLWLYDQENDFDKIAVCFTQNNDNPRVFSLEKNMYLMNIYSNEKRLL